MKPFLISIAKASTMPPMIVSEINLIDPDIRDAKLVKNLYIENIPVSYLIQRNGNIIGYMSDIDEIKRPIRRVPD